MKKIRKLRLHATVMSEEEMKNIVGGYTGEDTTYATCFTSFALGPDGEKIPDGCTDDSKGKKCGSGGAGNCAFVEKYGSGLSPSSCMCLDLHLH